MKKFIYIPSFDSGIASYAAKKDYRLPISNIPWKFWDPDFPQEYRHEYFLITAGHSYKKENYRSKFNFPSTMTVFGDSGGYQIVTGKLKWEDSLREKIFKWLEANSTIAINLDLPPRGTGESNFYECLDKSAINFKYFADNQTGAVDFLNVIHGTGYDSYKFWYDRVKGLPFQGWSIGGATGKLVSLVESLIVLLEGKEHLNPNNRWLHILGMSSIPELLVLSQMQKSLHQVGSDITLTTDSSTPSRSTTFGFYYTAYDLKNLRFQYIRIPRHREDRILNFSSISTRLPKVSIFDKYIWDVFNINDFVEFKTEHYVWLILHNYAVFFDAIEWCQDVVNGDPFIKKQFISTSMDALLDKLDEIIKSDTPFKTYLKYKEIFVSMARAIANTEIKNETNDFF